MSYPVDDLLRLMRALRHPDHGCPWDRKQTLGSLVPYTIEEAYEVADAIAGGDITEIKQELGDLLFQVVFYAQIAQEQGEFDLTEVIAGLVEKLLRRHPHVFPDGSLDSAGMTVSYDEQQLARQWDESKRLEREAKNKGSILNDIPRALPALSRASKLQKRAASVGFDWPDIAPILQKLDEEKIELEQAIAQGSGKDEQEELGDLLFTCVNIARHLGIDPEVALREANHKFERRFNHIEVSVKAQGSELENMSLEQLELKWLEAKLMGAG